MSNKYLRYFVTLCAVIISSFIQVFAMQTFMQPSNLISSGFTGLALLLNILSENQAIHIDTSLAILLLNIPAALLCMRSISPRFTFFSCIQFGLTALLLKVMHFTPILDDIILNVIFGGALYGLCVVIALKGNASTGGTDFIALYFSNKFHKSFWQYVFIFNIILVLIFGFTKGWESAGYSILFQFIATKVISSLHTRYDRLTMQITTAHPQEILSTYTKEYRHGVSCVDGYGGYSKAPFTLLTTVVSSYEIKDIVNLIREVDSKAIINIVKTQDFIGGFHPKQID